MKIMESIIFLLIDCGVTEISIKVTGRRAILGIREYIDMAVRTLNIIIFP